MKHTTRIRLVTLAPAVALVASSNLVPAVASEAHKPQHSRSVATHAGTFEVPTFVFERARAAAPTAYFSGPADKLRLGAFVPPQLPALPQLSNPLFAIPAVLAALGSVGIITWIALAATSGFGSTSNAIPKPPLPTGNPAEPTSPTQPSSSAQPPSSIPPASEVIVDPTVAEPTVPSPVGPTYDLVPVETSTVVAVEPTKNTAR